MSTEERVLRTEWKGRRCLAEIRSCISIGHSWCLWPSWSLSTTACLSRCLNSDIHEIWTQTQRDLRRQQSECRTQKEFGSDGVHTVARICTCPSKPPSGSDSTSLYKPRINNQEPRTRTRPCGRHRRSCRRALCRRDRRCHRGGHGGGWGRPFTRRERAFEECVQGPVEH